MSATGKVQPENIAWWEPILGIQVGLVARKIVDLAKRNSDFQFTHIHAITRRGHFKTDFWSNQVYPWTLRTLPYVLGFGLAVSCVSAINRWKDFRQRQSGGEVSLWGMVRGVQKDMVQGAMLIGALHLASNFLASKQLVAKIPFPIAYNGILLLLSRVVA